MAFVLFISFLFFGYSLTRVLPLRLHVAERVSLTSVLGFFGGSWIAWLLSVLLPYAVSLPVTVLALVCSGLIILLKTKSNTFQALHFSSKRDLIVWGLVTGVFSLLFCYMFYTHMVPVLSDGWHSNGGAWGDMALHLTLLNWFAERTQFSFAMPLIVDHKLTYPFLIDFLSSLFYRTGWSTQNSFLIPGLLLALSTVQLLFFLGFRIFKKASVAGLSLGIFLLNGSFAGLFYAFEEWRSSQNSLWYFLTHLPRDYTNFNEQNLHFTNFITTVLIPQRSILFGLPIFCLILILLHQALKSSENKAQLLWAGALLGLLPFAHVHTLLVGGLAVLLIACVKSYQQRSLLNWWVYAGLIAILTALPQVAFQLSSRIGEASFGHFHLGWMRWDTENFFIFWLRNMGLGFIFFAPVGLFVRRKEFPELLRYLYILAILLFVLVNVYILQPFDYDNLKILMYCYLIFSLCFAYGCRWLFQKNWLAKVATAVLVIGLVLPGLLAIAKENQNSYLLNSNSDITFARDMKKMIPIDAIVLTADQHNHPINSLTGRQVVLGYRGWLWTYGIGYAQIEKDVFAMYSGGPDSLDLLQKYQVSYVVIGNNEVQSFRANRQFFNAHFQTVYRSGEWQVYKVENPPA